MQALLAAVTELVALVSTNKIEAIASRIHGTNAASGAPGLELLLSTPIARKALGRVLDAWLASALSGDTLAGMLLGASHSNLKAKSEQSVELVWTGPTTPFVPTRRTEQVLLDIIRGAERVLFLVSFVAYDVSAIVHALNDACDRGVEIRILLESSVAHGGSLSVDPMAGLRKSVPSANLYAWVDKAEPFTDGKVHAKVVVADERVCFITSANLTGFAMEKNMEAGVLISGERIPRQFAEHFHALVQTKVIVPV